MMSFLRFLPLTAIISVQGIEVNVWLTSGYILNNIIADKQYYDGYQIKMGALQSLWLESQTKQRLYRNNLEQKIFQIRFGSDSYLLYDDQKKNCFPSFHLSVFQSKSCLINDQIQNWESKYLNYMQKYQIIKKLGSGTFGNVEKAENTVTKEIVAIKRLKKKYGTWEECLQLSQVKALRKMNHPNIIKLKEVIRVVNQAYFIFEYIQKDLYKLMTDRKEKGQKLQDNEIRFITKQLSEALLYIHKQGFFHRDMKPENILISNDLAIKIIDFGISREIRSKPPYTEYISTRWYRAPQLLFKFPTYSAAVDVFAVGCIVAEMYLGKPLFLGNSQMDQISKIVSILGSPSTSWPDGLKQATKRGIGIPEFPEVPLSTVIPNCPSDALAFIAECLRWDPTKRITSAQMVNHPFISKQVQSFKAQLKPLQSLTKKQSSNEKSNRFQRQKSDKVEIKPKPAKAIYDKDDEFDMLLNDFKNYQISSMKKEQAVQDDEWS